MPATAYSCSSSCGSAAARVRCARQTRRLPSAGRCSSSPSSGRGSRRRAPFTAVQPVLRQPKRSPQDGKGKTVHLAMVEMLREWVTCVASAVQQWRRAWVCMDPSAPVFAGELKGPPRWVPFREPVCPFPRVVPCAHPGAHPRGSRAQQQCGRAHRAALRSAQPGHARGRRAGGHLARLHAALRAAARIAGAPKVPRAAPSRRA